VNAEVFFGWCQKFNVELHDTNVTYLPMRLQVLISALGSGIVTVLFDSIDPEILNAFRAMVGSWVFIFLRGWWWLTLWTIWVRRRCYTFWRHPQRDAAIRLHYPSDNFESQI
jgi:hypothetical protein